MMIKISPETRDELKKVGRKGETYDDIIKKLIRFYIEKGGLKDESRREA
ncbi:MAG: hypothetical protein QXJ56_07400 [Ignisphaera sp.]